MSYDSVYLIIEDITNKVIGAYFSKELAELECRNSKNKYMQQVSTLDKISKPRYDPIEPININMPKPMIPNINIKDELKKKPTPYKFNEL